MQRQLHRNRDVRLNRRRKQGKPPLLILHVSGKRNILREPYVTFRRVISRAAAFQEVARNLLQSITQLHAGTGGKPVSKPALSASARAADPASHQISVIGVPGAKAAQAVVDETRGKLTGERLVNTFGAEFQPIELGEL